MVKTAAVGEGDQKELAIIHYYTNAFIDTMVLRSAVDLSIPDAVRRSGSPYASVPLIADAIPAPESLRLRRLLRYLSNMGIITPDDPSTADPSYALTRAGELLLPFSADNPRSLSPFVSLVTIDATMDSWRHLARSVLDGDAGPTAMEAAHGRSFFEVMAQRPEAGRVFDHTMAAETIILMPEIVRALNDDVAAGGSVMIVPDTRSFLDVGGGIGATASWISRAFPAVRCAVLDLPRAVERAREKSHAGGGGGGHVEFIKGDMFQHVPRSDVVMLKRVLHDFKDDECVAILERCRAAVSKALIIVEMVIDEEEEESLEEGEEEEEAKKNKTKSPPASSSALGRKLKLMQDMAMMALLTGRERSRREFDAILRRAGFYVHKETKILLGYSVIEARIL